MPPDDDENATVRSATPWACQSARWYASPSSMSVNWGCAGMSGGGGEYVATEPAAGSLNATVRIAHELGAVVNPVVSAPPAELP